MSLRVTHMLTLTRLEEGGVVRAVLDLTATLASMGIRVDLLTLDDKDVPDAWRSAGSETPRVVRLPGHRGIFQSMPAQAVKAMKAELRGTDVLHLHGAWEYANIQAMQACRSMGIPYVISAHGMLDDWTMQQKALKKKLFLLAKGNRAFASAAAIHATATMEREQIIRHVPGCKRVEVIPLLMNTDEYATLPGPEQAREHYAEQLGDRPFVLFLSRIHYKKGVDIAIRAIQQLAERAQPCDLAIAGTGDDAYIQEMRQLAVQSGVADRVHFLGMVRGTLKRSLYQAALAMVLPTSQENFGLVLPESMACATPVITTKGTDIWPDLQNSGGALIVDRTPQAFADAIATLQADPGQRATMGHAGRNWVTTTLSPEAVATKYKAFYESVGTREKG